MHSTARQRAKREGPRAFNPEGRRPPEGRGEAAAPPQPRSAANPLQLVLFGARPQRATDTAYRGALFA